MKSSIRLKMIVMIFSIIVAFVIFNVVLNSTLFKLYYSKMKEQSLVTSLQTVANLDFTSESLSETLLTLEERNNIRIYLLDENQRPIFSSVKEREPLFMYTQNIAYEKQVNETWGSYTITSSARPGPDGRSTSYLTAYARVIKTASNYSRVYYVFVNTPVVAIEDGAHVANRFTLIVGCMLLLLGGAATFVIGSRFASPIVRASHAASQVARLNFDERLPITSNDELGQLSSSINNLSDQLRTKIQELSVANEQLRQELQHKQRVDDMRRNFISAVSHELKTPLAIILGYCEGLQMNVNNDEKEYYCSVIEDEAIRMSNLASRLLLLAELESGESEPEMTVFDLRALADDRLSKLALLLDERGVSHRLICDSDSVFVRGDRDRIEEVINNLLTNAKNHTPDSGEISISITCLDGFAACCIHNTGSHIPEDSLDRIWDSFYKVDKARTRSYGGSGLGLKIVSTILSSHQSEYGANNTVDGVAFWFTLPQAEPPVFDED